MKIAAVVQARIGSSRLRGKVLADLKGRPMLEHVLHRAGMIDGVNEVVLAIPDSREDDVLEAIGTHAGVSIVRGDATDLLNRYHAAATASGADAVVRITADCPLIDPKVCSLVVRRFALGMDLPPEQVLGMSSNGGTGGGNSNGVSHWGAWQVEESTIKLHIEPMLDTIVSALTLGYLRPALGDNDDAVIVYDTSALRLRPDRSKEAFELYDRGLLSVDALLRENGFLVESRAAGCHDGKTKHNKALGVHGSDAPFGDNSPRNPLEIA